MSRSPSHSNDRVRKDFKTRTRRCRPAGVESLEERVLLSRLLDTGDLPGVHKSAIVSHAARPMKAKPKPKPTITLSVVGGPDANGFTQISGHTYAKAKVAIDVNPTGSSTNQCADPTSRVSLDLDIFRMFNGNPLSRRHPLNLDVGHFKW